MYLKYCTKSCPNCNNQIQKTEGCNKMVCSRCQTKFCWRCLEVLPIENPYSHFDVRKNCWDIEAAFISDEYDIPIEEEEVKNYVNM